MYSQLIKENVKIYSRGCRTDLQCHTQTCDSKFQKILGTPERFSCEVKCCAGDLCPQFNVTENAVEPTEGAKRSAASFGTNQPGLLVKATCLMLVLIFTASEVKF